MNVREGTLAALSPVMFFAVIVIKHPSNASHKNSSLTSITFRAVGEFHRSMVSHFLHLLLSLGPVYCGWFSANLPVL